MELDKSVLDSQVFTAFAETSKKRYIYMCNMETGVSRWSKYAIEYFGLPDEYMYNAWAIWLDSIHPDDHEMYTRELDLIFSGQKMDCDMEYRARNKDGEYVVCSGRGRVIKGENGQPDLFCGTIENHGIIDDIDAVSGLYNIYGFWKFMKMTADHKENMSVLEVSINNFGDINEKYGYEFGNYLIKKIAELFLNKVRQNGFVFRMDGVRFAFIFRDKDEEWIKTFYSELQVGLRDKNIAYKDKFITTISGGAVVKPENIDEYSVLASASFALSKSKHERHGQLVFFDNTTLESNRKNLELLEALRHSVLNDCEGFYICYQPLISAKEERLVGMEALLRWRHETFGEVPPGMFIPWLENDACFYELGNWILEKALTEGKPILEKYPDFVINVNIAYTQLENVGFKDAVEGILSKTGFPAKNLCLELTERCRVLDKEYLKCEIEYFKSIGIKIAIDDFGTGFSSLNLLSELPVDTLKIDRGFVLNIEERPANQAIVEAVSLCARKLGVKVCIEGVETRKLIDFLEQYGAYSYQGYYYSKPIRREEFIQKYV